MALKTHNQVMNCRFCCLHKEKVCHVGIGTAVKTRYAIHIIVKLKCMYNACFHSRQMLNLVQFGHENVIEF